MFSPYYALARARDRGDPEHHVCMNVALYGKPRRWAMTERGAGSLARDVQNIAIGASAMRWDGEALTITLDETTVPIPSRLRGTVVITPRAVSTRRFDLDASGRHRWQPIGALSDVTVALDAPALSWRGTGYLDTNDGDEPLEDAFRSWTWTRFDMGDHARIFYDVVARDGTPRGLSLSARVGGVETAAALPLQTLAASRWGIHRAVPCEAGSHATVVESLEDTPFYARAAVRSRIDGVDVLGVHESLSLRRLTSPAVRLMLPFKMFRRAGRPKSG